MPAASEVITSDRLRPIRDIDAYDRHADLHKGQGGALQRPSPI